MELIRPNCVEDNEWASLTMLLSRIERATKDGDHALVLGTAKDLCEAVAKITYQQRSERFGSGIEMSELIPGAHRLVDRLPAVPGGAQGGAVRDLAQGAMKIATRVVELRNRAGSGHGRPEPIQLDAVDSHFAAGASILWCSWILARLDALVANDPDRLARDIGTEIFYKGELEQRLNAAGLAAMDDRDQRVVGFAVGQRGGPGGTWNVFRDGVSAAIDDPSMEVWPVAYREAVAEGLLTDRNGYISVTPSRFETILAILSPLTDHGAEALAAIRIRLNDAEPAYFVTDADREAVVQAVLGAAGARVGPLVNELLALAEMLQAADNRFSLTAPD